MPRDLVLEKHLSIVYVIAPDENGPCKIGITANLQERLHGLQPGCWLPLRAHAVRACFRRDLTIESLAKAMSSGARKVEEAVHRELTACDVRLCGEWFDISAGEAVQAIEVAAKKNECAAVSLSDLARIELPDTGVNGPAARVQMRLLKQLSNIGAFMNMTVDEVEEMT